MSTTIKTDSQNKNNTWDIHERDRERETEKQRERERQRLQRMEDKNLSFQHLKRKYFIAIYVPDFFRKNSRHIHKCQANVTLFPNMWLWKLSDTCITQDWHWCTEAELKLPGLWARFLSLFLLFINVYLFVFCPFFFSFLFFFFFPNQSHSFNNRLLDYCMGNTCSQLYSS